MEIRGYRPTVSGVGKNAKSAPENPWVAPEVTHNRPDANQVWADEAVVQQEIKTNLPKETAAISTMSSEQQAQYQKVVNTIPASDPDARLSLQQMLLDGRLPGEKDLLGQGDLLTHLATLAEQSMPTDLGQEREKLLGDLLQELDDPTCIDQKGNNTCGATTVQIMLANRNPSEYARLMAGLASVNGESQLASGEKLTRQPGTSQDDGTKRTVGTRLMAPAFMDYANGSLSYDNASDSTDLKVMDLRGLVDPQIRKLASDVLKEQYKNLMVGPANSSDAVLKAAAMASPQAPVIASLTYGGDDIMSRGHYVQITGIKDGKVSYINPWGQVEKMDEAQFKQHLLSVLIPNQSSGLLDKAKNIVNTADMLKDIAGQQIEQSGIVEQVEEKATSIKDQVINFFKGLF